MWLSASLALAAWPHMYSIETTPIEEVLDQAEFVFLGTVTQTDTMVWYGPEDQYFSHVHTVRVDEEIEGHIQSGWIRLWLELPMGMIGVEMEGGEVPGQVLVIGHTKRFYCFNGPCSRSPSLAGVPAYQDVIVPEAAGSAFQAYSVSGGPLLARSIDAGTQPLTDEGWDTLVVRIRGLVRASETSTTIAGWQP